MTHVLAGPYCAYQLALLGADVIKIEDPAEPDMARGRGSDPELAARGLGINFQTQGGQKRGLGLDLKSPEGVETLKALVAQSDVLIENYRPGALAALGLGYAEVCKINPGLIYCSISGLGQEGVRPRAYDNTIQAATGIMARTGSPQAPIKAGASMVDYASGMAAALAITTSLYERTSTGRGRHIDCSMFDVALTFLAPEAATAVHQGPSGPSVKEAGLGCYQTLDGHLMLGAFNVRQNHRLWTYLGDEAFAALDSWQALWAAAPAMRKRLETALATRSAQDWEEALNQIGVPAAKVVSLDEAVRSAAGQDLLYPLPSADEGLAEVRAPGLPFKLDGQRGTAQARPPRLGEHTDEILAEFGFDAATISFLKTRGAVA